MDSEAAAAAAFMEEEGAAAEEEEAPVKKHELVRQLQFPPGFRFLPTEEELVDIYLRCKIEGQRRLPLDVINEVRLLEWQPGRLVEAYKAYGEEKWYFFAKREPSSSNKEVEPDRKVKVPGVRATWKATGSLVVIRRKAQPAGGVVVGTKRVLIYHSSDAQEDGKWSMHEYVLTNNSQIGQYALYSIQRKQHSDTESKNSRNSKRKMEAINKEPGGKTTKRKKAAPAQQQKQEETTPQDAPPQPPITPPKDDQQTKPQQESPPSACAPTTSLVGPVSVPVLQRQGCPSSDGNQQQYLGVSAPMSAGHAQQACCNDDQCQCAGMDDAQFNMLTPRSLLSSMPMQQQAYPSDENQQQYIGVSAPMSAGHAQQACSYGDHVGALMDAQFNMQTQTEPMLCHQLGEQLPSLVIFDQSMLTYNNNVDGAQYYQPYQQTKNYDSLLGVPDQLHYTERSLLQQHAGFFPAGYTTQNSSNLGLEHEQVYQQGYDEDAIGVQHPYGFRQSSHEQQQGHDAVFGQGTDFNFIDQQFPTTDDNAASFVVTDVWPGDVDDLIGDTSRVDDLSRVTLGGDQDGSNHPALLQRQQDLQRLSCAAAAAK